MTIYFLGESDYTFKVFKVKKRNAEKHPEYATTYEYCNDVLISFFPHLYIFLIQPTL